MEGDIAVDHGVLQVDAGLFFSKLEIGDRLERSDLGGVSVDHCAVGGLDGGLLGIDIGLCGGERNLEIGDIGGCCVDLACEFGSLGLDVTPLFAELVGGRRVDDGRKRRKGCDGGEESHSAVASEDRTRTHFVTRS